MSRLARSAGAALPTIAAVVAATLLVTGSGETVKAQHGTVVPLPTTEGPPLLGFQYEDGVDAHALRPGFIRDGNGRLRGSIGEFVAGLGGRPLVHPSIRQPWTLQVLPPGLIYRSYLAGQKEPRFASTWVHQRDRGWIWDVALGGRVGILRYGTQDARNPEGLQIDLEGAGFPRLDLEHQTDVIATDFRFGVPVTFGDRRFQTKLAFYHLSSHLGDEFMVRWQTFDRINYSRNVFVWGNSFYCTDALRLFAEAGWAFYTNGGSEPWEFQFGIEYVPSETAGLRPVPFLALDTHLREDVDFGGNLVVQTGWAWRGAAGQLFRMGMQYYTGKSDQFEFFDQFEDKLGLGLWYDY